MLLLLTAIWYLANFSIAFVTLLPSWMIYKYLKTCFQEIVVRDRIVRNQEINENELSS